MLEFYKNPFTKLIKDYYTKVIPTLYFTDPAGIAGGFKKVVSMTVNAD